MEYVVTNTTFLRSACINNNWFNAGTNSQYEKMFAMNRDRENFNLSAIAVSIYICTDGVDYIDIEKELYKLQNAYYKACKREQAMYAPLEEKIVAYTHGECPYKRKKCDGLCNNCGIVNKPDFI